MMLTQYSTGVILTSTMVKSDGGARNEIKDGSTPYSVLDLTIITTGKKAYLVIFSLVASWLAGSMA